ncbi:MAG: asparagine synthase-related protein [Thiotrichaceae bacterium]
MNYSQVMGYRFDQQRQTEEEGSDLDELSAGVGKKKLWGDGQFFYEKNYHSFKDTKTALYSQQLVDKFDEIDCTQQPLVDKSKLQGRHALHKRSYLDFKFRLSDHLLADHGDRVAYANSVEARYPFLDVNVIAAAQKLPPNLLLNGMLEKYILKKLSARYLPEPVIKREKFSFVAPGSPYLLQQNVPWINDLLSYQRIKQDGYFNPDTVERLKKIYSAPGFTLSQTFDDDLLMLVLAFNIFLDTFALPRIGF